MTCGQWLPSSLILVPPPYYFGSNENVYKKASKFKPNPHRKNQISKLGFGETGRKLFPLKLRLSSQSPPPRLALAVPQPCALRQPQQTQYLGESAELPGTAATSLELPVPATTLWSATCQQFPLAAVILAQSLIQSPPMQRPTHLSAQPARASVRSESPHPAERTNKKTAGSHGTGSLEDRPPLLRHQVSSPAPHRPELRRVRTRAPKPHHSTNSHHAAHAGARLLLRSPPAPRCPARPSTLVPSRPTLSLPPSTRFAPLRPSPATALALASGAPLPPSFSPPPPAFSSVSARQHACNGRRPHHRALRRCHHRQPLELQLQHSSA